MGVVALSDLNESPRKNWVEKRGGLPKYVVRIAKHLIAKGFSKSHAIATAINVVKKMAASGDLNWPGKQNVNAKSRGEAVGAVGRWESMKNMAEEMATEGLVEMARSEGTARNKIGGFDPIRSTASPKFKKPGTPPGVIPSTNPTVRSPRGSSIVNVGMGMTPKGGVPKRVAVRSSAAKGKGPSDSTKVMVKRVREAMSGNASWNPNAPQSHRLGSNTDSGTKMKRAMGYPAMPRAGGPTPRKKAVARDAAKGVGHARPAHLALAMTPGAPIKTSNTQRAASVLKKIRAWGKPRKAKKFPTIKPTKIG